MKQNVELKARLRDLSAARRIATQLASLPVEQLRQSDTYFGCAHGRLKLREIHGRHAELIAYDRPDHHDARTSQYRISPVADGASFKELLATALGVLVVVEKERELYLHENVRIHLDQVAGLGDFLEFEAVLRSSAELDEGHRKVARLSAAFGLAPGDLVASSYSDLLLGR